MKAQEVFPFEYVEKGSKIIVYGLGRYGISYIEQVCATQWCEIAGVADIDESKSIPGYRFINIDKLKDIEVNYIIIAIAKIEIVNQVYKQLIEIGIPDLKIISTLTRTKQNYKSILERVDRPHYLQVLFQLGGGLGDCVVNLCAYEEIAHIAKNMVIDIQCTRTYGEALYKNAPLLRKIYDKEEVVDVGLYDLVLMFEYGIRIVKYDSTRCMELSPDLNEKVQLLIETERIVRNDVKDAQERFAIQSRLSILRGWDRFYTLGHGDVLNLKPTGVCINLLESYRHEYEKLQLKKYITLNRGADRWPRFPMMMQVKVWPMEYYERLVIMLKGKYPEYEIVQLGGNDTEQIQGVDRYIKGQSLELVKYILKNSVLHFDCEGGLVHLATALGTKCAVVFGPTSVEYYGYSQNINITAGKCCNCMHLLEDWYVVCLKGQEKPECMYGITPDIVLKRISKYLDELEEDIKS